MELNVEVAVRTRPTYTANEEVACVQPNIYNNTIQLGNSHTFPVTYALPTDSTQQTVFATTVSPLLNYLFEGCDVSVVTFGQASSGKSYTLLGPGLSCISSEAEYGIIPRFLREIFAHDKCGLVHITWTQICGENVQDLLAGVAGGNFALSLVMGAGSVQCHNRSEAFELLQLGMSNMSPCAHTLFTVTLEQQFFLDGVMQHKVSTASFVDLASCEKVLMLDSSGLTQSIPTDIGLQALQQCIWALSESAYNVPYNRSALTMLLRDSFGGRAKTLLLCCVSPLFSDFMETFYTLSFSMRAQMVKNLVTINSYTSDVNCNDNTDVFGLQFAANQLFKLVANAECLFKNLIIDNNLSKSQQEQISQWLTFKQECKDCLSETSEPQRSLERIDEEIENDSGSEESEILPDDDESVLQNLDELVQNFCTLTDNIVRTGNTEDVIATVAKESNSSLNSEYRLKGARGRRGSIHSVEEFLPLNPSAVETAAKPLKNSSKKPTHSVEVKEKLLKQVSSEIESCDQQIKELEVTVQMKEKLVQYMQKHKVTKGQARDKLKQKYQKLQSDQSLAHSKLLEAKSEKNDELEQKYSSEVFEIAQKLQDAELIKALTEDDGRKIAELEVSLSSSKKQLEKLRRHKLKEEKRKTTLEVELKQHQKKKTEPRKRSSNSRTSHSCNSKNSSSEVATMKYEINELRRTRDFLLEQIYKIDTSSQSRRLLSELQERTLLQCEEAIEAIDTAIEFKNQTMCSCFNSTLVQEDRIDQILTEQILKLSKSEIRMLLKKYFEKVIELRHTTKKLEQQISEMESQNENLIYRVQNFSHTLQRIRSETEHRILSLQQQHENKLQLMMRYLSNSDVSEDCVASRVVERSKQAALAFKVSQGLDKQDKGSFIARFTSRYARHETVPRQLQAAITPPQAKVTRQKNKLIIQQSSK